MRIVFAILLSLISFASGAQAFFSRDIWLNEANTSIKVNQLLDDKIGYTWLGTSDGLYSFNGRSFSRIIDKVDKPVTALGYINKQLWVGYEDGTIGYIVERQFVPVKIKNVTLNSVITHIYSEGGNVIWVATEGQGIIGIISGIGVNLNVANGLSDNYVYMLASVTNKAVIAGTDKGINEIHVDKGKLVVTAYTTADGLPDNIVRVLKQIPNTERYWVGTQQGGLAVYDWARKKVWVPTADSAWAWGQINDILPMSEDRAWVATETGYMLEVFLDGSRMHIKPTKYNERKFYSLLCGRSGILWAGTEKGATMMTAEYMGYVRVDNTFRLNNLTAMVCDPHNNLWYALANKLYRLDLGGKAVPVEVLSMSTNISSLYADDEDRLWIGTLGKGLWYRDPKGKLTNVADIVDEPKDKAEMRDENILHVTGTDDRLWVSGLKGVKELSHPGTYTKKISLLRRHNKHSGIGSDYIYQLYPDRQGRIWMATDGAGVCMYGNGRYRRWGEKDGLSSLVVYAITQDAKGNMWAGTLSKGLFKFDGERWIQYAHDKGLKDLSISTLAANATGQVIVAHAKGIDVWYPGSGQFRNNNRKLSGHFIDSTSTVLKAYAKDSVGNVYMPFDGGFVIFKNLLSNFDIRPTVNISGVSVFFKPVPFGTNDFSHDQNHISFKFDGINFTLPDNIHYRYKLEGYNDSWIITNDESVTFAQLPTGKYRLRVQASLNDTYSRQGEASYTFYIGKPVWRRLWFIIVISLLVIGIAYGYIRFREENLRKVTSLQRERMMFEYEHLKSQVNPHFLFNSLNTLTSLIEEDKDSAMVYTSRLSDLYRNMLSYRDKDLIYLYEEWEILENYMYIQQSRFGKALHLNANIPDELMYSKRIVPLALQLLVENAIKHNIVSQSLPLTISIDATEDSITIRNVLRPKISKEKGAGLGLINIRNRYSLLTKKSINFGIKNNEYVVTLPLI